MKGCLYATSPRSAQARSSSGSEIRKHRSLQVCQYDHDEWQEISDAIMARLGRGVTILHGEGGYSGDPKKVLYCVITRLEVEKLKGIVSEKDDNAFVTINEVHDVIGGRFKKKAIH